MTQVKQVMPNVEDLTDGALGAAIKHAKATGLWRGRNGLYDKLRYLALYGNRQGCQYDRKTTPGTRCKLYRDFAPYSFNFVIEIREGQQWKRWFNGGLIYSGPDSPVNGSFPTLTVSIDPYNGWSTHT
jgi:hypothetical protein